MSSVIQRLKENHVLSDIECIEIRIHVKSVRCIYSVGQSVYSATWSIDRDSILNIGGLSGLDSLKCINILYTHGECKVTVDLRDTINHIDHMYTKGRVILLYVYSPKGKYITDI